MQIWVDADACPVAIKEIIYRAAIRTQIITSFVANQLITIPLSPFIKKIKVSQGFDVADNYIVTALQKGDLVITGDIPLADAVISKEGFALNPRGELYTQKNIKQKLAIRNYSEQLRSSGVITKGPSGLSKKDIQEFANALDRFLNKYKNM